jgi:hypothetical protein
VHVFYGVEKREKEKDSRYIQKASAPAAGPCIRPVTSCTPVTPLDVRGSGADTIQHSRGSEFAPTHSSRFTYRYLHSWQLCQFCKLFREFIPYLLFVSVHSLTLVFQLIIFKYAYDFSYDRSNLFSHHQHVEGRGSPRLVAISLRCID